MANKNTININLDTVHRQMRAKYLINEKLNEEIRQAQEIEDFLNSLNKAFIASNSEIVEGYYGEIVKELKKEHPKLQTLFKSVKSGKHFEQRLSEIFLATALSAAKEANYSLDKTLVQDKVWVGAQTGTPFKMEDLLDDFSQKVLKLYGVKASKILSEAQKEILQGRLAIMERQRKTDVQGVDININFKQNTELSKIYGLLKGATFSAKNYNSDLKQFQKDWWSKGIKLGSANYVRSIGASLKSLGYSDSAIMKALYDNYSLLDTQKDVRQHFDHLAFIYELTGGGMRLNTGKLESVKFFIFNDPAKDKVIVRSTRALIVRLFDSNMLIAENIKGKKIYSIRQTQLFKKDSFH